MFEKYVEIIDRVNQEKKEKNKHVYEVIKLYYEIELGCIKKAKETFEDIVNNQTIVAISWPLLVRSSFMIGKIERLYDFFQQWKNHVIPLDEENDYNYLFLQYCSYRQTSKVEEAALNKYFINDTLPEEIKSIVCFLLGISGETEEEQINYFEMAYITWKKNYAALWELIKYGRIPESLNTRELLYNNVEYTRYLPYKPKNEERNSEFEFCVLGGGNTIGGSCYLLKMNGINILIDVGAKFGEKEELIYPDFTQLQNFGIKGVEEIDLLLITHGHLDHAGGILELYKRRPNLPIFMTEATKEILYKNLHFEQNDAYLTTQHLMDQCLNATVNVDFRKPFVYRKEESKVSIEFFRAGHILGAASIYLESNGRSVFVTGDYCLDDQKCVQGMDIPSNYPIDILITESTYGANHAQNLYPRHIEEKFFIKHIVDALQQGKRVLIPAFALGRSQEIISLVKAYLHRKMNVPFRVYVDGLVTDMCKIYSKYTKQNFGGRGIFFANHNQGYVSKNQFIENEVLHHKCCIIASSGMIKDKSASSYYAEKLIEDENAVCVLTGYQDEETVGGKLRKLINKGANQYIEINGHLYKVTMEMDEYYLSAHAQFEDIINMVFQVRPYCVLLVHGIASKETSSELFEKLSLIKNLKVIQTFDHKTYQI